MFLCKELRPQSLPMELISRGRGSLSRRADTQVKNDCLYEDYKTKHKQSARFITRSPPAKDCNLLSLLIKPPLTSNRTTKLLINIRLGRVS